ncbi:helix-turn-helix domain-containing protein [Dyadobacter sandarakinus]|uniref:Helix-turn-helix transcriptional regulator n=1 Tax=Dyadobacter sandarakinus TaxID=2747268 RepID=A0ABX7I981_9BACT|nr:helix-turn-helix transcriptional regulator [Dyadobacter sandarakinus]QRR02077.1 helix-turn-helix transcriptional regulator [Dyadobacter sandarakinus]
MKLDIKNMVCDRCKKVVRDELEALGITLQHVGLGSVETVDEVGPEQLTTVREVLLKNGFELLDDRRLALVEHIKTLVIEEVQNLKGSKPAAMNFSDYLSEKTGYEYSYLSSLFSSETGQTIEQYIIAQKVEKVKEWLTYNELTLSEMAWRLSYSSSAHLSNQFKKVTGMTPGEFRKNHPSLRKALDQVGS